MTLKMEKFVHEYARCGNASEAARRAGYSHKTAYNTGHKLLLRDDIQAAVKKECSEALEKVKVSPEWWLAEVVRIAQTSGSDGAKIKALELVGKHLNVFTNEMTLINKMDDSELDALVNKFIDKIEP